MADAQHAHPGALRQVDFLLMQVFPHGWPFVQRLQQDFCASSSHSVSVDGTTLSGQGV